MLGRRVLAATLIVVLLAPQFVVGQGGGEPSTVRVEEPTGDVRTDGPSSMNLDVGYEYIDIVDFWIGPESPETFEVGVSLAAWDYPGWVDTPAGPILITAPDREVHFRFADTTYMLRWYRVECEGKPFELNVLYGELDLAAASFDQPWSHVACVDGEIDEDTATMRMHVPKELIRDSAGAPLRPGQSIDGARAWMRDAIVYGLGGLVPGVNAVDLAPDEGWSEPFTLAAPEAAPVVLSSPAPVRFSNGESTTIAYEVVIDNLDDEDHAFIIETNNVRPEWAVRVPQRIEIEAGSSRTAAVILSMGFTHGHGQTEFFEVTARAASDESVQGSIDLGVHWPEIPQPAGHHNVLYAHSVGDVEYGVGQHGFFGLTGVPQRWSNPLEDDPTPGRTQGRGVYDGHHFSTQSQHLDESVLVWQYPLSPPLRMGLEFERNGTGLAVAEFESPQPYDSVRGYAAIWRCLPGDQDGDFPAQNDCETGTWHPIVLGFSDAFALGPGERRQATIPVNVVPGVASVPFVEGSLLLFEVGFTVPGTDVGKSFQLTPAFSYPSTTSIELPLLEYHDPVEVSLQRQDQMALSVLGAPERLVNPGRTAVFELELENTGSSPIDVEVALEGHNVEWATIHGPTALSMAPGETMSVPVAIAAPEGTSEGERAEVFVVAHLRDDAAAAALARLRASVTTAEDIPDEAGRLLSVEEGASSPGAGPPVLVLLVALAAVVLRRRRH